MAVKELPSAIKPIFHRSVNLEKDWRNPAFFQSYIVTPEIRRMACRMCEELLSPLGSRAWSLTGPYGTGKSAFLLFLADVLARLEPLHEESREIRALVGLGTKCFYPVLVTGRRGSLTEALLSAVDEAMTAFGVGRASASMPDAFSQLLQVTSDAGYDGILVIVDECGKFLEHASLHPEDEDLYALQLLAELAARQVGRMALVTVFHSAFGDYLDITNEIRRREWQKIQGRFTDFPFMLPLDQMLELVAGSFEFKFSDPVAREYQRILDRTWESPGFVEVRRRFPGIKNILSRCLPLEPTAALILWPLFRSKMAQNERSLFGFLTSSEPYGFLDFLARNGVLHGRGSPLYTLDMLYDYVTFSIGAAAVIGDQGRKWAEIQAAVDQIPADAPVGAERVVKVIGMLSLYGAPVGLSATREAVESALPGLDTDRALAFLQERSLIVYRRYNRSYAVWEGSDINLDEAFAEALRRVGGTSLRDRLAAVVQLRPWVARSHYIETGTLRYFHVKLVEPVEADIEEFCAAVPDRGDGKIGFILVKQPEDRKRIIEYVQWRSMEEDSYPIIFAIPRSLAKVDELVRELEAWTWVRDNVKELQGDRVAREEVRVQLYLARQRLEASVGSLFGLRGHAFDPRNSEWVFRGERRSFRSTREFAKWLSDICNDTYRACPPLHNELLNRDQLSSAAAAARRSLLEAMIERANQENLGIVGAPAEATMYAAMLKAGGMHQPGKVAFGFGRPDSPWTAAWDRVEQFMHESTEEPRPISDIYDLLRRPPFGMREGPIPVLLVAVLLANQTEVALYENGLYVPELRIEVVERMIRNPEHFAVRSFRLDKVARRTLQLLTQTVTGSLSESVTSPHQDLLRLVKAMVVFAANLVPYARQTRRLSNASIARVRETLLGARDPYALMFRELPEALSLSLEDEHGVELFVEKLSQAIVELRQVYDKLLLEIEDGIRGAFSISERGIEAYNQLRARASQLVGVTTNNLLDLFVREACREDSSDWRERLGRVLINGLPPSHWRDSDVPLFFARLRVVADDFMRLEELVHEAVRAGGAPVMKVTIFDPHATVKEYRAVLQPPLDQEEHVSILEKKIWDLVQSMGLDASAVAAALRRLVERTFPRT